MGRVAGKHTTIHHMISKTCDYYPLTLGKPLDCRPNYTVRLLNMQYYVTVDM